MGSLSEQYRGVLISDLLLVVVGPLIKLTGSARGGGGGGGGGGGV